MSKNERLQRILNEAEGKEKKYDWLEAAELHKQALPLVGRRDFSKKGKIQERAGYCFYRAAFQADTQEEFKSRMGLSVEAYELAAKFFHEGEDPKKQARIDSCGAAVSYSKSWLTEDLSERRVWLDECRRTQREALQVYEETGGGAEYGKACNDLLAYSLDRTNIAWDWQECRNIEEEAIEYGEKAIKALFEAGDDYELARAYFYLSFHLYAAPPYESIEKQAEMRQKGLTHAEKALEISEKTEDSYLIGWSCAAAGGWIIEAKGDYESAVRYHKRALELGQKSNDKLMMALTFDRLAYAVWWKTLMEEDPDKRKEGFNKCIQHTKDAKTHFKLVSLPPLTGIAEAEYVWDLAYDETDLEKKKVLLEKAIEIGRRDLDLAKRSDSPGPIYVGSHALSKALFSLSTLEIKMSGKERMLEEAAKYREEAVKLGERLSPFDHWNRGVMYNYLAKIKAERAKIETNKRMKTSLVEKAVLDMGKGLKLGEIHLKAHPQTRIFDTLGHWQHIFGSILNQLYSLTGEQKHLERAIMAYEEAAKAWKKTDRRSAIAEAHWHIAKLHSRLGNHSKAAEEFENASEKYTLAAEKIPQLKAFYADYAMYMQAWSEIEKAKHAHAEKQYGPAREHYEKAANLHESTERWNHLSPNYSALARVEEAEDLSRREQTEEARDLFQQAAKLFTEAKEAINIKQEEIEAKEEIKMAADLGKASDTRREYCRGRIALEEAKILDRQGNHAASSAQYSSAAESIQKAIDSMENELDRRELRPIADLCQAWQKMKQAEAEASPDLYMEASKLFDEARKHSLSEKTRMLTLGHSCFCKALEAGTKFETTRDMAMYSGAKKHLEAAANHYVKAGFKNASEYARATNRLFDAYMYMHKAETEADPRNKTQYYTMAEKLLQTSAGSYMKAKHPEKGEEVQRLLESVREERQLAKSLTELLHAPVITSTTTSFSSPTPTQEQPVGLERFEHADIQANLILRAKEVKVGEDMDFAIELVNAGKAPALLVKVDEIAPKDFEIKRVPEIYLIENSYVNMKGKRLDPLKTEDVKIVVKPLTKGVFTMKPRILYLDETGKYKSHEPDPVTITVKELGISGWIKGER